MSDKDETKVRKHYFHKKLIRDFIPKVMDKTGDEYKIQTLIDKRFEKELRKKLVEESKELLKSKEDELINELADVLELTKSICTYYKIPFSKIEKYQETKRKKRGAFRKKLFLVWSTGKAGK